MEWSSFDGADMAALTRGTAFMVDPGQRDCPSCGAHTLRAYLTTPPAARRPTLVSYAWCSSCRKFVGSRSALPAGLFFTDPLATLSTAERRTLERTLTGFLDHLDRLWDDGVLPQSFSVETGSQPPWAAANS